MSVELQNQQNQPVRDDTKQISRDHEIMIIFCNIKYLKCIRNEIFDGFFVSCEKAIRTPFTVCQSVF